MNLFDRFSPVDMKKQQRKHKFSDLKPTISFEPIHKCNWMASKLIHWKFTIQIYSSIANIQKHRLEIWHSTSNREKILASITNYARAQTEKNDRIDNGKCLTQDEREKNNREKTVNEFYTF